MFHGQLKLSAGTPDPKAMLRYAVKIPNPVYDPRGGADDAEGLARLLNDTDLPVSLKYSAILAVFARLAFPLRFADFRASIPGEFWANHFSASYSRFVGGSVSTYWEKGEWFFHVHIGPTAASSYRSQFGIQLVTESALLPSGPPGCGMFEPPEDAPIFRYTLLHPFLKPELHEPSGVYLLTMRFPDKRS